MNEKIRRAKQMLTKRQITDAYGLAQVDPDTDEYTEATDSLDSKYKPYTVIWIMHLAYLLREQRADA